MSAENFEIRCNTRLKFIFFTFSTFVLVRYFVTVYCLKKLMLLMFSNIKRKILIKIFIYFM